jgi:hypothetical protein
MSDDMFSFIDWVVEMNEDELFHSTVTLVEAYFDLMEKRGVERKKSLPPDLSDTLKPDVPLPIALSMLRPDELEKLQHSFAAYLAKHGSSET